MTTPKRESLQKILTQFLIILLLTMLVACSASSESTPSTSNIDQQPDKILKIGVLAPLTGPSEANGQDIKRAVTMAFEAIEYTVGEYQIELLFIDSKSEPDLAAQAFEKAIVEDQIQVGLLNWHSSVAVAVMEVTAKHKIPHFFGMGATDLIVKKIE
ncbi:MAG: ABC transporter substrate-binding protein, partial [Chloroflexota bacterium]